MEKAQKKIEETNMRSKQIKTVQQVNEQRLITKQKVKKTNTTNLFCSCLFFVDVEFFFFWKIFWMMIIYLFFIIINCSELKSFLSNRVLVTHNQ